MDDRERMVRNRSHPQWIRWSSSLRQSRGRVTRSQETANRTLSFALLTGLAVMSMVVAGQDQQAARQALIARGKSLELPTKYVPPPGTKIEHYAAGYAKIMCTAVFVTGLDPAFAMENVGYFTAPYEARKDLGTPKIDRQKRTVEVTMPNGIVQTAKQAA